MRTMILAAALLAASSPAQRLHNLELTPDSNIYYDVAWVAGRPALLVLATCQDQSVHFATLRNESGPKVRMHPYVAHVFETRDCAVGARVCININTGCLSLGNVPATGLSTYQGHSSIGIRQGDMWLEIGFSYCVDAWCTDRCGRDGSVDGPQALAAIFTLSIE